MKPQKIISGSFRYVARVSREWYRYGYRTVKTRQWPDGRYTIIMERLDAVR